MTRKKKIYIVIGVVLACWFTSLVYMSFFTEKKITRFYDNDPSNITKIELISGSDGEIRTITDADDIKKITDILSTATFKMTSPGPPSGGWLFNMNVYEGDNDVFNLYKGSRVMIYSTCYNMSDPEEGNIISLMEELLSKYDKYK